MVGVGGQISAGSTARFAINQPNPLGMEHMTSYTSSTPGLIIQGHSGQTADLTDWTNSTASTMTKIMSNGVISSSGTAPAISSCGTGASKSTGSSDMAGTIPVGSAATGCTLTFSGSYTNDPSCVISDQALFSSYTHTNTGIVVSNAGLGGTKFDYVCVFHDN